MELETISQDDIMVRETGPSLREVPEAIASY